MHDQAHPSHILRQIERQGSLTAAAGALNLTQSALSHAVRKLEDPSGARIWGARAGAFGSRLPASICCPRPTGLLPQLERLDTVLSATRPTRGALRIGMECHPCYRWLLKVVEPYLGQWPGVDIDVVQVIPVRRHGRPVQPRDRHPGHARPAGKTGVMFVPVFAYEQVLAVAASHRLAGRGHITPEALSEEVLLSYPVEPARLDVFAQLLTPAHISPGRHKTLESTDIMLQLVAAGRGVSALPRWLVAEYAADWRSYRAARAPRDRQADPLGGKTRQSRGAADRRFLGGRPRRAVSYTGARVCHPFMRAPRRRPQIVSGRARAGHP